MKALRVRGVVALIVAPSAASAALFLGCIDLFHSTSFETLCQLDASAPGCKDAGGDRGTAGDAGDTGTHPSDASRDAKADGHTSPGTDASTDFCMWSPAQAAAMANHACLWLGACAGTAGANDYNQCFELAVLAYDCTANPNQKVHGLVHSYWDALWQAKTCTEVMSAFPGGMPPCPPGMNDSPGCSTPLIVGLCNNGTLTSAQNCAAQGLVCGGVECATPSPGTSGFDCTDAGTAARCDDGGTLHLCRLLADSGSPKDIGKNCTDFGAGRCVVVPEAGTGGCAPNDASLPIDASATCDAMAGATCVSAGEAGTLALGCATGVLEAINCSALGSPSTPTTGLQVNCTAGAATSRPDLASVCYAQFSGRTACLGGSVSAHPGTSGPVVESCADAGLGPCNTDAAACTP